MVSFSSELGGPIVDISLRYDRRREKGQQTAASTLVAWCTVASRTWSYGTANHPPTPNVASDWPVAG